MTKLTKTITLGALTLGLALPTLSFAADSAADTFKSKCAMCHGADGKGETPAGKKMGVHDFGSPEVQGMKDT